MPLNKKLVDAAKTGDIQTISTWLNENNENTELLSNKINTTDSDGFTLLHHAALYKQKKLVEFLLDQNANIHAASNQGFHPIHIAAAVGSNDTLAVLLAKGADIHALDKSRQVPLHAAAFRTQAETIRFLLAHKAVANKRSAHNETPLHLLCKSTASSSRKLAAARVLIEEGNADLDIKIICRKSYPNSETLPLTMSEYAQECGAPEIADLIDEIKRQEKQNENRLQNRVAELEGKLKRYEELEQKVRHLEKKIARLKASQHAPVEAREDVNENSHRLFASK